MHTVEQTASASLWGGQYWLPPRFYAAHAGSKAGSGQNWLPQWNDPM